MIQKGSKNGWRLAVVWFGLLSLAILTLHSPQVWASHNGPVVVVDAAADPGEDIDGDYHFQTIQAAVAAPFLDEYSVIQVKPGRYEGDLVLNTLGISLEALGGPLQTTIVGKIEILAKYARIEGFSIESPGAEQALSISADGARVINNRISGATHGIVISSAQYNAILSNRIYNHASDAVVIKNSSQIELSNNEIRGNGGAGIWLENGDELNFAENSVNTNGLGGLWLRDFNNASITGNVFQSNNILGINIDGSSNSVVSNNELTANEVGIVLGKAINNSIDNNRIQGGRAAGLVMKNGSQGNKITNNRIQGNQGAGSNGIRLAGNVFNNELSENQVIENGAGLVLVSNETGSPANNLFQENEFVLSDSSGVLIERGSEQNKFSRNKIYQNLQEGITSAGHASVFEQNEIYQNGTVGIQLTDSDSDRAEQNIISENGAEGMLLLNATDLLLAGNQVFENLRDGLKISGGNHLRLQSNRIAQNGSSGLHISDAERLSLIENIMDANRDHGAFLEGASQLVFEGNTITSNGRGGVYLNRVSLADLSANLFSGNMRFGLFSDQSSDVSAQRNYWGDPHGPAGAFAGRGDAALGVDFGQLAPWLPSQPENLQLETLAFEVIDSPDGPRIMFEAPEKLGLQLEIHNPDPDDMAAMGIIIAAQYNQRPDGVPALDSEMGYYSLNVDGIDGGTADITIFYREEDQPLGLSPNDLRLFIFKDNEWQPLHGTADPQLQRVTGEISLKLLSGALIGLGTIRANNNIQPTRPQENPESQSPDKREMMLIGSSSTNFGPPYHGNLVMILLAFLPLLTLLVFYLFIRFAQHISLQPHTRLAHLFRMWNL